MRFSCWDGTDNLLYSRKHISIGQLIFAIENRQVVDVLECPDREQYKNQKLILVKHKNYIYSVLVRKVDSERLFIEAVLPSRFYTKKYIEDKFNAL